jgi:hypothetical protein
MSIGALRTRRWLPKRRSQEQAIIFGKSISAAKDRGRNGKNTFRI